MKRAISMERRRGIIQDLLAAQGDLMALAQRYKLDVIDLARVGLDHETRQYLSGLCLLADMQTQLLLSRYRVSAASKLIELATEKEQDPDLARKACFDLLRTDLKRTDVGAATSDASDGDEPSPSQRLRDQLYGEAAQDESAEESAAANED